MAESGDLSSAVNDDTNASQDTSASVPDVPLNELLGTRSWLNGQLLEYQTVLDSASTQRDKTVDDNPEDLEMRIKKLQDEVAAESANFAIKNLVLRRLQLGQELCKQLFPPQQGSGEVQTPNKEIVQLVSKQTQLVSEILKTHKDIQTLRPVVDEICKENYELKQNNRELMSELEKRRESINSHILTAHSNSEVKKATERVDLMTSKADLVRHLFQGLILGSGLNWAQDEELRDLVVLLGTATDTLVEQATENG